MLLDEVNTVDGNFSIEVQISGGLLMLHQGERVQNLPTRLVKCLGKEAEGRSSSQLRGCIRQP